MSKIIIAGDSWACGEWPEKEKSPAGLRGNKLLLHKGITHYLAELGHEVTCLACGGQSNFDQLRTIIRWCSTNTLPNYILFVVTDPLRDAAVVPGNFSEYRFAYNSLLDHLYRELDKLGILTLLVGGVVPVDPGRVPRSQVRVVCEDWVKMIVGYRPVENLCRSWIYPDADIDLLKYWEQEEQKLNNWLDLCREEGTIEHKYFWPDGRHPNRLSHSFLIDHIRSQKFL
jgi:hypothetical protein